MDNKIKNSCGGRGCRVYLLPYCKQVVKIITIKRNFKKTCLK